MLIDVFRQNAKACARKRTKIFRLSYLIVFYRPLSVGWAEVGLGSGADLTDRGVRTRGALSSIVMHQIKQDVHWRARERFESF